MREREGEGEDRVVVDGVRSDMAMARHRTRSTVMSLQTLKEGYLYKRGKINTDWRHRLFILNGKQLSYFKGGVRN